MSLGAGEVPVFVYHDVDPEEFRRDLAFLSDNGYRTLTTDEFLRRPSADGGERAVLLTFDDALRNFWDVVLPLLRQFGACATLFAATHWMEGAAGPRRDGEPDGGVEPGMFMTWEQLRASRDSGLVDVQSHGHRHALVYTSSRLVDFASPALLAGHHLYDWPMRRAGNRDVLGRPPMGTPIYESTPLLSAEHRMLEDESVVDACVGHVEQRGGLAWFSRNGWRRELLELHARSSRRGPGLTPMPAEDYQGLLESEVRFTRERFERELGGPPRFLAFPWMLGSARSLELAARAGVEAVFGVGIDFRRIRRMKGPLPAFGRSKGEWLRFLPGRGRARLSSIVPRKMAGFFRDQHLAH